MWRGREKQENRLREPILPEILLIRPQHSHLTCHCTKPPISQNKSPENEIIMLCWFFKYSYPRNAKLQEFLAGRLLIPRAICIVCIAPQSFSYEYWNASKNPSICLWGCSKTLPESLKFQGFSWDYFDFDWNVPRLTPDRREIKSARVGKHGPSPGNSVLEEPGSVCLCTREGPL